MTERTALMPGDTISIPMPADKLENYGIIGAKILRIGDAPQMDDMGAFLNYADTQLLIGLVNQRVAVAEAAASRHSEIGSVASLMREHDASGSFTYETLEQEFDAMVALPNNYIGADPDVTILFVGFFTFLYRTDDIAELRESFLAHVGTVLSQGPIYGPANFLVPGIFWYGRYEGFEERVLNEYRRLQLEAEREKAEEQRSQYRSQGRCQHCGGSFKGLFSKTCGSCGKPKDY